MNPCLVSISGFRSRDRSGKLERGSKETELPISFPSPLGLVQDLSRGWSGWAEGEPQCSVHSRGEGRGRGYAGRSDALGFGESFHYFFLFAFLCICCPSHDNIVGVRK